MVGRQGLEPWATGLKSDALPTELTTHSVGLAAIRQTTLSRQSKSAVSSYKQSHSIARPKTCSQRPPIVMSAMTQVFTVGRLVNTKALVMGPS